MRAAAERDRVVIAVSCDGVLGEATSPDADVRLDEPRVSAPALRVVRAVRPRCAEQRARAASLSRSGRSR
jgi:hypothetical protein